MKRNKLIELLNEQYPPMAAFPEDFIGLQVKGKDDVNKVIVFLDLTSEAILQAISEKADMIIVHHPFIYGERDDLLAEDKMLKAKVKLFEKQGINVFVIHTNADFNPESIAYSQAIAIELCQIQQLNNNLGVSGSLKEYRTLKDFTDFLRVALDLTYDFRTNVKLTSIKKIIIGSGAAGSILDKEMNDSLYVIGEMKHHEWIYALENNLSVLEIGHFSEKIFKNMVKIYLDGKIDVTIGKEKNEYKTV